MLANVLGIDRLLVVVNPASTMNSRVELEVIDTLDDSDWVKKYDIIKTTAPDECQTSNVERIRNMLLPNIGIVIAGGDGLVNDVMNASDGADDDVRTTARHLVLPYGSGNDTARSLHGRKGRVNFLDLLDHGTNLALDLIDVTIGKQKRAAISYVGMGWTALGSEAINLPNTRKFKKNSIVPSKIVETAKLAQLLVHEKFKPTFSYVEADSGMVEASEILFSKLPSMAGGVIKVEKSRPGEVVCIEIEPDGFLRNITRRLITQGFIGGMKGEHISNRTITVEPGTVIHFDGEAERLTERTDVAVSVKPSRINCLVKARE